MNNKYVCTVKTVRNKPRGKVIFFLLEKIISKHEMFPALIWASHVVQLAKGIFPQEPGKIPNKQTIY